MKKQHSGQISLNIPVQIKLKLAKPLYFSYSKTKWGILSEVALAEGDHDLTAVEYDGSYNRISGKEGNTFLVKLEYKKGIHSVSGFAKHLDNGVEQKNLDFRINAVGSNGKSLRPAQIGAVYALMANWSLSKEVATIVLPTGTGKTETMLVTALADRANRVLVVVPTIDLKRQIADKFSTWGILRELGVISGETRNPVVLVLEGTVTDPSFISVINSADVVVTTPAFIARTTINVRMQLKSSFSHVFFDEAHHIQAKEWSFIKDLFTNSKIVQFTATPYRNDRRPIEGKIVYNYPLSQALKDECFSKISLISVDERHPQKKDQAIAESAMKRLTQDRKEGYIRHKMMVRADKRGHAEELLVKYREWFPKEKIVLVHSQIKNRKAIIDQIKKGTYDIVICVDMLKEGFDFPDFKIAAVHKLHQSLGVLLQFIGRFARTQDGLGDASFIVNFADEDLSFELEDLLQEGSGWEYVISEIADAKKAQAESLLSFLQGCKPYSGFDSPDIELNPKLVYPALSCVCFRSEKVKWELFKDAFNLKKYAITQPYFNEKENVFYFTTQKREKVKWARTDKMSDQTWGLIVMHHDKKTGLLYIGYSEKVLDVENLAEKLTEAEPVFLNGDCVFRSFDSIKRLSIVHAGIFKPANHLHRYSRLSGADVTTELSKWKEGKRCQKSDFVGIGFRNGEPVSVGASVKGKIWSPARIGDLQQWKSWCLNIGKLITDETINSNQLLENSAEKKQLTQYPGDLIVLATDWSEELYDRIHKLSVESLMLKPVMLSECSITSIRVQPERADFLLHISDEEIPFSIELGGEKGHNIIGLDTSDVIIVGLKSEPITLKRFFEENPPTMFLINGCTIAGCIHTNYSQGEDANLKIPLDRIESLGWEDVVFTIESMYKKGFKRDNSIQEYIMQRMVNQGAKIVFNDDNSGESADVVAIFQDENLIRFKLIHCKYSKDVSGTRLNDLFEVCGQAIVSLRYKWKPEELLKHMERRDGTGILKGRRFYHGNVKDLEGMKKALRYTNVKFEFSIAQPGVKTAALNAEMMEFLGSIYSTVIEMTETKLKCYFN